MTEDEAKSISNAINSMKTLGLIEMKQTAVQKILQELQDEFPNQMKDMWENNQLLLEDIFLKAKEMEKEQIQNAYCDGKSGGLIHNVPMYAEQYYNETFKK